jgi:hypothetical protein
MAKETLPDADDRDDAMDFTRERLDGRPVGGWRAPFAAWLERAGVWFGAASPSAPSGARAAPFSERRLSGRQKLARGTMIGLVVTLTIFILLNGVARGALSALSSALFPPRHTPTIPVHDYALEQLPLPAQHLPRIALAPETARPGVAYACWVNSFEEAPASQRGSPVVYKTEDFAHTWRRLQFPKVEGRDCDIVTGTTGSAEALVTVWPGYITGGLCLAPRLFLTLNGGVTWRAVPWAMTNSMAPCDIRFALDGVTVFAWSTTQPLIAGPLPADAVGRLIVTRDAGATWSAADSGLPNDNGLALVGFRAGGRILATAPEAHGPPGAAALMESTDYGASWRNLGDLPGAFPIVYASTDPSATRDGGWGRLYEIARPLADGAQTDTSRAFLATVTIGAGWTPIPLPPLLTGDEASSSAADTIVLGVGPAQSLLVERSVVASSSGAQLSPERRLWAWSVAQGRWLLDPQPSLGNADLLGWGWSHGDQTFWITSLQLGLPPTLFLFTKTYTAASLGPAR